jgi:fructokinase
MTEPTASPSSFVVAGESLVDIVIPADGGEEEDAVGGSCLNVAVGLARLDVPTTLVTRIGDDRLGSLILEHLRGSAVMVPDDAVVAGGTTSTATAHLDAQHAATYEFDLHWELPAQRLAPDTVGLHVGSLGATLQPGRDSVVDLVDQAVSAGTFVSYDPNIRPFFLEDPETAWREVLDLGRGARLVKLSDEDLELLRPGGKPEEVCRELLAGDETELVVLTRGAEGAVAFAEDSTIEVPAPPTQVVDTVGAGDSFMASMLALLCEWGVVSGGTGALAALADERVRLLVQGAARAAAVTCSRRGSNPPTRRELPPTWPVG